MCSARAPRCRAQCDVLVIPQLATVVTILPHLFVAFLFLFLFFFFLLLLLFLFLFCLWLWPIRKVCSRRILGRDWPSLRLCWPPSWTSLGPSQGLGWPILELCGPILGPSWGYVGPACGHLGGMLGQLAPLLGLMLGHAEPS